MNFRLNTMQCVEFKIKEFKIKEFKIKEFKIKEKFLKYPRKDYLNHVNRPEL